MSLKKSEKRLEDMITYLKLEVPHYLGENFTSVKPIDDFSYRDEGENIANTTVYEVTLSSGKKVFAVKGGLFNRGQNCVYGEELPNPQIASNFHLYTLLMYARSRILDKKEFDNNFGSFLESLDIPKEYRK